MYKKLACIILLSTTQAFARVPSIDIIQVRGAYAVTRQEAQAMAGYAVAKFAQAGIQVKFRRISTTPTPPRLPAVTLANWRTQASYWQYKLLTKGARRVYYVMLPPFIDGGKRWIAGEADFICAIRNRTAVAVGNAQATNQDGADRLWQSALVMTHELGHELGAYHDTSYSIMNQAATSLDVNKLQFSQTSVNQMRRCIGRAG